MKITFVKTPRPRRYVHKNIYYDPEKEAHDERQVRVNKELGIEPDDGEFVPSIKRGSFRRRRDDVEVGETRDMRAERRMSNIRFVVICLVLLALAAFLYFSSSDFLAL